MNARIATPAPAPQTNVKQIVSFRGTAGEYFRIWIVNTALTLLTLGVYSAWAKVRSRRFFYGNTYVGETNFSYHGKPTAILKGRAILLVALGFGLAVQHAFHLHKWQWILLAMTIGPVLMAQGLFFTAKNTAHRGIRFSFDPNYKDSYLTFGLIALGTLFSGGIGASFAPFLYARYRLSNLGYGPYRFKFKQEVGPYLRIYAKAAMISALISLPIILLAFKFGHGKSGIFTGVIVAILAAILPSSAIIRAGLINETARQTSLGPIKFRSAVDALDLSLIYASNAFAIVFSLGLCIPWAMVRTMKYRASRTLVVVPAEALSQLKPGGPQLVNPALHEAMADIADFDLGF